MGTMPSTIAALALSAALLLAGCGDNGSGGGYGSRGETTGTTAATRPAPDGTAVVAAAENPKLGKIIVDAEGLTLYDFHKDHGGRSACYGACAGAWPPLVTGGAPKAEGGAQASQLGTIRRKDGATQVTYAGRPLYTYAADLKPGDAKGNDIDQFGAEWYAMQPNGEEPED